MHTSHIKLINVFTSVQKILGPETPQQHPLAFSLQASVVAGAQQSQEQCFRGHLRGNVF